MKQHTTHEIYDAHAARWSRTTPVLLSDFTARPRAIEALGPLEGLHVLDLGCGEGYVARLMAARGAASIYGVDLSGEMVKLAQRYSAHPSCELTFVAHDVVTYDEYPRARYERAVAVFLFNYLTRAQMTAVMRRVRARLAPGGRFVFTVPHPCLPFMRPRSAPFYFDPEGRRYDAAADETFEGEIWNRGQGPVPVRCVHKTFTDYFEALREAGFSALPHLQELSVTAEHLALDPEFFGPLAGDPLHVLFSVSA